MTKTEKPKELNVRGWRAVPCDTGGYYIHRPGSYNTFAGWVASKEVAEQQLDVISGAAYDRLPAIKMSDLREDVGPKLPLADFPYRPHDYYQNRFFYQGEKCLGKIQYKKRMGRSETLTMAIVGDDQSCVIGSDLRWMLAQHGLRLVD